MLYYIYLDFKYKVVAPESKSDDPKGVQNPKNQSHIFNWSHWVV